MQKRERDALSRRAFVGKVATTSAAGIAALALTRQSSEAALHHESSESDPIAAETAPGTSTETVDTPQAITETAPAPWELIKPLAIGSTVVSGWKLVDLSGVRAGSSVATLENDNGRSQRVHICRNAGTPQGVVYTDRFDLVVMNGGRGDLPTEESFGQAVAEIAHIIARNEAKHADVAQQLLPQSERLEQFAATARLR